MAGPLELLHELRARVSKLEMRSYPPQVASRARIVSATRRLDAESIAIIRYLQTSTTNQAEDRDVAAIRAWLNNKDRPAATGRPSSHLKKGNLA